ncbi:response regulator receiver sensor signal transduction histidine kinase [Caenispirillum salinarum AK4]|uniref:Response regulator receiver sensor signal transduction histidine kinase n=1 Tax=Caenispirillum salinarum AK4 TaxID=1238182 RepID=K9GW60_9PROT|nr:adenylate/guanylate cyclase domain-containing protein [Caenispirillum salinarum]EKV29487.1 response regulator receiver sensor signal transduction histidine kinase [Caenispirillum salinarum AK4]
MTRDTVAAQLPRVLIVDDDAANRDLLEQELEAMDCDPLLASDGMAALAMLEDDPPDLVLLDVMMPVVDGFSVLAAMRGSARLRDVPVVMISALDDLASVVAGVELGADDYLTKPFEPALLRARVQACLEKKRWRDREAAYLREIEAERARADALLHAILPAPAVTELKATGRVTPRRHEDVAVLFADIVGFTRYAEAHPPEQVVEELERLLDACDGCLDRHGLEKIKGVGDGVAVTANLLLPNPDPVGACLRGGLDMLSGLRAQHPHWRMRVGIDAGPVLSAAVGRTKFSFDVWGDVVNVASRLSGLGADEALYLTDRAWRRLGSGASTFSFEALGPVPVRGRGDMVLWRCRGASP